MRVALFDIDGTLVTGETRHAEAFTYAFKKTYGIDAQIDTQRAHGNNDQRIILETLLQHGLPQEQIQERMGDCMHALVEYYNTITAQPIVLPGVRELLSALTIPKGLVTGNLEAIAYRKLGFVGLDTHFSFGGFGSDDPDRATLVQMAMRRANATTAALIGDTPNDMHAAKQAGATAIGVATGNSSRAELEAAGSDYVLDDLSDTQALVALIQNT